MVHLPSKYLLFFFSCCYKMNQKLLIYVIYLPRKYANKHRYEDPFFYIKSVLWNIRRYIIVAQDVDQALGQSCLWKIVYSLNIHIFLLSTGYFSFYFLFILVHIWDTYLYRIIKLVRIKKIKIGSWLSILISHIFLRNLQKFLLQIYRVSTNGF